MARSAGWDERIERTRRRITDTALDLFEARGFDAVTVGEVAAAAGVSERSVFRHFATKEELVLADRPDAFAAFIAALHQAPAELSVIEAISVTNRLFAPAPGDVAADTRRIELIRATPSLHRAWIASLDRLEPQLREWLAARTGHEADSIVLRAATAALLAVHRVLVETWTGEAVHDYLERTDRALAVLDDGLRSLQSNTRSHIAKSLRSGPNARDATGTA